MAKKATYERLYQLEIDDKGRGWQITYDWGEFDGRFEVVGFHVISSPDREGNPHLPITAEVIRKLPLGTLIRDAKRYHEKNALRSPEREHEAAKWGPKRGQALTIDDLQVVADAYDQAWRQFMPVTEAVATACNVSRSTAGKRIMAARKAGLIPERSTR